MLSLSFRCSWCCWGILCLLLVGAAGCEPPKPIRSYKVPKPEAVYEANHLDPGLPTDERGEPLPLDDRMLAALIPHKDTAWFVKLSGPKSQIDPQAEAFLAFVKSIRFPATASDEPEFDAPESWTRSAGPTPRWATLTIGETSPPLEVTISSLPFDHRDLARYSLQNINRWRTQLSLRPIPQQRLSKDSETLSLAGGPALYVDMLGKLRNTGMARPNAMAGHPPVAGGGAGAQAGTNTRAAPASPDKEQAASIGYDLPSGWSKASNDIFSQVALEAGEGADRVRVTFSALNAAAIKLNSNINRWRRQIGLGPLSEDELKAEITEMEIGGTPSHYVEFKGPQEAIYGAIVVHDNKAWFLKLRGSTSAVAAAQSKFLTLLKSIRFE